MTGNERDDRGSIAGRAEFFIGFKFLIEMVMKGCVFWDIIPCSPSKVNRSFGETCRLSEEVGNIFIRNTR
jgi:hypothetical protein